MQLAGKFLHLGNRRLAAIRAIEDRNAINVTLLAGQNRGAAGRANGVDACLISAHPGTSFDVPAVFAAFCRRDLGDCLAQVF
jgi:hypothetical protein